MITDDDYKLGSWRSWVVPEKAPMKDHCVIGREIRTDLGRTWLNEDEAVKHAQTLVNKPGHREGVRLFVVKVVKVVERSPPPTIVRDLLPSDMGEIDNGT